MASVYEELQKNGFYSTKTQDEYQEAMDLFESGLISIELGGSTTFDGVHVSILNCTLKRKRKPARKSGKK